MTSICEKNVKNCLYRISLFRELSEIIDNLWVSVNKYQWKSVPTCRDENWFPQVIVGGNLFEMDGLRRAVALILYVNTFAELTGYVFYVSIAFFFLLVERETLIMM